MKRKLPTLIVTSVVALIIIMTGCDTMTTQIEKAPILPLEDFFKNPEKTGYQRAEQGR